MADLVSINGRIVHSAEARLRAVSSARFYGKGVFTTIAIFKGEPLFWDKHWRRLAANAASLGIDISHFNDGSTSENLTALIENNQIIEGRARITFSDESPGEIWGKAAPRSVTLSIVTAGRRDVPENLKLSVSPHKINTTSPLAAVKSCNYLEHLMAFRQARDRGFDEAVRLNERGEVASACMANVFWLKDERLFTPSLRTGCLRGTTREHILENLECEEVEPGPEVLQEADAVFVTSAGIGVGRASEFNGRALERRDHPIMHLIPGP